MIDFGIIAAGDGNRIKEEGSQLPKPLLEIQGVPMIGRLISIMEKSGAKNVSIIVNKEMPDVVEYVNKIIPENGCEIKTLVSKTPSSMHSFYELIKLMNPQDKFVITTVDTIFKENILKKFIEYFESLHEGVDGLMGVTTYIDDEKPLYIDVNKGDFITAFNDFPSGYDKYISAGVYGLKPNALSILKECLDTGVNRMRNFQRKLVEEGLKLKVFDLGQVLDIDHLTDLEKANKLLL